MAGRDWLGGDGIGGEREHLEWSIEQCGGVGARTAGIFVELFLCQDNVVEILRRLPAFDGKIAPQDDEFIFGVTEEEEKNGLPFDRQSPRFVRKAHKRMGHPQVLGMRAVGGLRRRDESRFVTLSVNRIPNQGVVTILKYVAEGVTFLSGLVGS